ncbi:hypothetical protein IW140_004630 [Coemansia sp. RSA 1813]|nr:hypothetical protein EV178_002134 [Coemansia sp. RSA 1646]KAJ1767708.1 hypothetical protein LPJ74_005228 [Coemansia sp. RSA 1843]KAJ2567205.1 hypothetical protein IW140_004630 [Coemansia sp. RSA 1813]
MATEPNTLLTALGDYGSDRDSSDSENSQSHLEDNALQNAQNDNTGTMMESDSEDEANDADKEARPSRTPDYAASREQSQSNISDERLAAYRETKHNLDRLLGCEQIPDFAPRPEIGKCSVELQEKFAHWYALKRQGANFNDALMRNKTFRNPNIYKRLVDHLDLEETGSNMTPDGFDSATLRKNFTAEGLASEQERRAREYAARKTAEAAANGMRKIQFQSAGHQTAQTADPVQAQNGRSFEEAVQRAKLIAQHLAKSKK